MSGVSSIPLLFLSQNWVGHKTLDTFSFPLSMLRGFQTFTFNAHTLYPWSSKPWGDGKYQCHTNNALDGSRPWGHVRQINNHFVWLSSLINRRSWVTRMSKATVPSFLTMRCLLNNVCFVLARNPLDNLHDVLIEILLNEPRCCIQQWLLNYAVNYWRMIELCTLWI